MTEDKQIEALKKNAQEKLRVLETAKNELYKAVADAIVLMGGVVNFQPKNDKGEVDPNAGFYSYAMYTDGECNPSLHYLVAAKVSEPYGDGDRTIYLLTEYDSTTSRTVYTNEDIMESDNYESLYSNYVAEYTLSELVNALCSTATPVK